MPAIATVSAMIWFRERRHDIANNLKTLGIVGSKLGSAAKIEVGG